MTAAEVAGVIAADASAPHLLRSFVFIHPEDADWAEGAYSVDAEAHGFTFVANRIVVESGNAARLAKRFNVKYTPTAITTHMGKIIGQQVGEASPVDIAVYRQQMASRAADRLGNS